MAYTYYFRSLKEVMQEMIDNIHNAFLGREDVDTKEGTFLRDVFINPTADQVAAIYGDMEILKNNQSIIYAIGDDLDLLAANFFVTRKPATRSTGKVRFYIANTNKAVSEITDEDIPEIINIPVGTRVFSTGTMYKDAVEIETLELLYYGRNDIKVMPIDSSTGYRYLECAAQSVETGSSTNIEAGEISRIAADLDGITFATNPYAFSGGTDREDDASLTYRIQLTVTGNNIGTKDGYLKYVLDQPAVIAANVVGAGDNIMFRDGGYLDASGNYHWGEGGCVDIYVRGNQTLDDSFYFTITPDFVTTAPNILIPNQPATNILSIRSNISDTVFINAENYDSEVYTYTDGDATIIESVYCIDILWDFSLTDSFPDTDYYSLPVGYTTAQIEKLKLQLDNELLDARSYMTNMSYSIDWAVSSTRSTKTGSTELFEKIYINDAVYKIRAKEDSNLDGRVFVMHNDKMYVRAYVQPDYILEKDTSNYAGGMTGKDSIKWLNTSKLLNNDVLYITYNYDYLINSLQIGIEDQKCMTADVLVKQAVRVPLEIIADITIFNTSTIENARSQVSTYINEFISSFKIGGRIDRSDIVRAIKQCEYVDHVNIDTLTLSRKGETNEDIIEIADNEYFALTNLTLNITVEDNITV